jgi:hypothetical protein
MKRCIGVVRIAAAATSAAVLLLPLLLQSQQRHTFCEAFIIDVIPSSPNPIMRKNHYQNHHDKVNQCHTNSKGPCHTVLYSSSSDYDVVSSSINNDRMMKSDGSSSQGMTSGGVTRNGNFIGKFLFRRNNRQQEIAASCHANVDSSLSAMSSAAVAAFPTPTSSQDVYNSHVIMSSIPSQAHSIHIPVALPVDNIPQQQQHSSGKIVKLKPTLHQRRHKQVPSSSTRGLVNSITKNTFESILHKRLHRWSRGQNVGMDVQCHPSAENNPLHLARGRFVCDASLYFDQITFGNAIRFSGGTLDVQRLRLNLWRFVGTTGIAGELIGKRIKRGGPRYLNQFDLIAHNITMTQDDLYQSHCIRNGLESLLSRILTNRGITPKEVKIETISILPCGKLSIAGVTVPKLAFVDDSVTLPEIPFEVRSNLGTASRGHVVTVPNLELSLTPHNNVNKIFVPIVPELTVDLGHDTQITFIEIDPKCQQIQISAKVTITPEHTLLKRGILPQHIYQQSSKSFAAMCAVDVGHWLTKIGQFTR